MSDYLSEKEQVELIKNWLKKYGLSIVLGVVVALIASFTWRYVQQYDENYNEQASLLYEEMLYANQSHQINNSTALLQELMKSYERSPYAALAALNAADQAVGQYNLAIAKKELSWVTEHSKDYPLKQIAYLRLARIALTQQQPQVALNYLNKADNAAFAPAIAAVRGDAYAALGKNAAAIDAYQLALKGLPENSGFKTIIAMKLTALGGTANPANNK